METTVPGATPITPTTSSTMLTSPQLSARETNPYGIQLPKQLDSVKPAQVFSMTRHRWNTNEEIASILIAFSNHAEWQSHEIRQRPPSGCMLLFNRNQVRYRKDGYCWKKRKDGKTIREDHMKLKVQGLECIYGSYVHSGILPTFHRRCYWLLQNPDIVLVHYLNVPYPNCTKLSIPVLSFSMEKKEWTKEELIEQLKPMFSNANGVVPEVEETIQTLVQRLIENQDKKDGRDSRSTSTDLFQKSGGHKPTTSHICCCAGGASSHHGAADSHRHGTVDASHTKIELAQGPVILNLGSVASGQLMLVTSQGHNSQLSLLTHTSTAGQLTNLSNITSAQSQLHTDDQQHQQQQTCQNNHQQQHHQQQTQEMLQLPEYSPHCNVQSHPSVYAQNPIVGSFGQQTTCITSNGYTSFADGTNISSVNQQNENNSSAQVVQGHGSSVVHKPDASIIDRPTSNIDNNSRLRSAHQVPTIDSGHMCHDQGSSVESMQQQRFSDTNISSNEQTFDSLVDELQLELMSPDKDSQANKGPKRTFEHLGDSFEGIQASIQGSDLNLDQLDLIDMPDFVKIYSDISNTGMGTQSNAMGGPNDGMATSESRMTNDSSCSMVSGETTMISNSCTCNNVGPTKRNIFQHCHQHFPQSVEGQNLLESSRLSTSLTSLDKNSISQDGNVDHVTLADQSSCFSVKGEGHINTSCQHSLDVRAEKIAHMSKSPNTIATITDFSPDWAYTEGQTKVLVTGPWHSNMGTYTVLLDGKVIATTLVQPGVLRCFVPGHLAGLVTLQVSCDNTVISNSVVFEYRDRIKDQQLSSSATQDWFSVDDLKLKREMVAKMQLIESALSKVPDFPSLQQSVAASADMEVICEVFLTRHLESFSTRLWTTTNLSVNNGSMGLSLLHLAAALDYDKFISALIKWRTDNPSWLLEYEVDAHSTDLNTCSPLMWACARGHTTCAVILYKWNKGPLHSFNCEGNLPLFIARQHGHHKLADQLELLDVSCDLQTDCLNAQSSTSGIYPPLFESQPMCSSDRTMTRTVATPDKKFFTSAERPAATSTPVLKGGDRRDSSSSAGLTDAPSLMSSKDMPSPLHIDIPESSSSGAPQQRRQRLMRRQSEQILKSSSTASSNNSPSASSTSGSLTAAERRQKLKKRLSVDIISHQSLEPVHFSPSTPFQRPVRETSSEPHLSVNMEHFLCEGNPMLSEGREMGSPEPLVQLDSGDRLRTNSPDNGNIVTMDTDDVSLGSASSYIDVERVSSDEDGEEHEDSDTRMVTHGSDIENPQNQMVHLAKQIIAAMPERIKSSPSRADDALPDSFERERSSSYSSLHSASPHASSSYGEALSSYGEGMSSYGEDSGISTPMRDGLAFDEYRYAEVYSDLGTPASSLSPDSTYLHSPYSPYSFNLDSPPPTAAEFVEYFNAPATFMEKDFSQLTLSDREQRKLYEAAKVIQSAYRQYRVQCKQQNKEKEAAILIQSYYRRYKQYAYYKKMTQAAVLIQSQFRSYYAQKRFKKSRDAAVVIQNQYRSYKEHERLKKGGNKTVIQRYRSHYQRKAAGPGKGGRMVQIVPDTGDGSQAEAASTATDDCHQDTTDTAETTAPSTGDAGQGETTSNTQELAE